MFATMCIWYIHTHIYGILYTTVVTLHPIDVSRFEYNYYFVCCFSLSLSIFLYSQNTVAYIPILCGCRWWSRKMFSKLVAVFLISLCLVSLVVRMFSNCSGYIWRLASVHESVRSNIRVLFRSYHLMHPLVIWFGYHELDSYSASSLYNIFASDS